MVQVQRDHSPHIQEITEEVEITAERSTTRIYYALPKTPLVSGYSPGELLNEQVFGITIICTICPVVGGLLRISYYYLIPTS